MNADTTVAMRPVQVARTYTLDGADYSVIGQGLAAGEAVISEGQLMLVPGAHVRVLKAVDSGDATRSASGQPESNGSGS
jgi:hypothetical protein